MSLKVDMGAGLKEFVNGEGENFYNLLARDLEVEVSVVANREVMHALKKMAFLMDFSTELITKIKGAQFLNSFVFMCWMCCNEGFKADIELDNTTGITLSEEEQEFQSALKMEFLLGPAELHQMLKEHYPFGGELLEDLYKNA